MCEMRSASPVLTVALLYVGLEALLGCGGTGQGRTELPLSL